MQIMFLHSCNDALLCKVFRSSLGELGLLWFDRLKSGSISCFKDLSNSLHRFVTSSRQKNNVKHLLNLRKNKSETLRSTRSVTGKFLTKYTV